MTGRKWTIEEKLAIVLEGLKGQTPISEICREHQVSQTQFYKWRDRFLEAGKKGLEGKTDFSGESSLRQEVERLQKLVGKQALQIDILKKTEEIMSRR
ncbi:MAG: transposase [Acidobacteriota bacterium]